MIELTHEDARHLSRNKDSYDDLEAIAWFPYVREQLDQIPEDILRDHYAHSGSFGRNQIVDHHKNLLRHLSFSG